MITTILLRSSVATVVAWAGGATGAIIGGRAGRKLNALVIAALGALLAVTLLDILPDALRLLSIPLFTIGTLSGVALFWIVGRYIYPVCPACSSTGQTTLPQVQLNRTVVLLAIALAVHSTMDGAAVVIGDTLAHGANVGVFFAVSLHKFPEGLALVLLLIGSGIGRWRSFFYTVGIETATELGALGALLLVTKMSAPELGFVFANIGGGFLYLVVTTLIMEKNRTVAEGWGKWAAAVPGAAGFVGTTVIMFVGEQLTK